MGRHNLNPKWDALIVNFRLVHSLFPLVTLNLTVIYLLKLETIMNITVSPSTYIFWLIIFFERFKRVKEASAARIASSAESFPSPTREEPHPTRRFAVKPSEAYP